jgi:ubiquinone/menaquinone biosynthesis C-methylase UbiE
MFALEFASRGAEVVAVEARAAHLAKARWVARELGLANVDFVEADVRSLGELGLGSFDVVLCMGIVYHLRGEEAVELLRQVGRHTERLAVIEGQVSLRPTTRVAVDGAEYHGRPVPEPPAPWSAVENTESFWLSRPSLLNALRDAGFTSVAETAVPFVEDLAAYRDHVQLLAFKGTPVELAVAPQASAADDRVPERTVRRAHPDQGRRARWTNRALELRGRGLSALFTKR